MAQYKWKQIDKNLPAEGVQLLGDFSVTGSLNVSGNLHYNSQSLDIYIDERIITGSNNWNTIINKPANIFSGSFTAGTNITIDQVGQDITISTAADVIPDGTVSGSSQINFLGISNIPDGLVSSSLQILPIVTSSISNFDLEVSRSVASFGFGTGDVNDADIANSIVTASLAGSNLIMTKRNLSSFTLNLGDVVPDTPTGSFVDSGSFDLAPAILTLYRPDGNLQIDLSGLGGSINDGDVTAVFAGSGLGGGGEGGDLVLNVNASSQYGTRVYNDYIAIDTGSLYFREGVESVLATGSYATIFKQTGSFFNTTNNVGITGSLKILGGADLTGNVSSSDSFINDWGSVSASLASNLLFTTDTSASLASRITDQEAFSSSLDDTFATDAELNAVSASLKTFATDADTVLSSSLAVDIATNKQDLGTASSSLASRLTDQEAFSSSLDDTFATDLELSTVSASLKTFATDADTTLSASLATDIATNKEDLSVASSSLASRLTDQEAFSSSLDDTFATDLELNTVSASLKTFATDADTTLSASLAVEIATNASDITSVSSSAAADIATNVVDIGTNRTRITSLEAVTGSYATTGSNSFIGDQNVTGDLTVTGVVTAQEFHSEFISASIIYESGSTKFGDTADDNHAFTGSLGVSGSISGLTLDIEGDITSLDIDIADWGSVSSSLSSLNVDRASLEAVFNSYTSSTDLRLDSLQAATSSYLIYSDLAALNLYTGSADSRLASLEAATGSYLIYSDLAALNLYTGSADSRLASLEAATGSYLIYSDLAALNLHTGSANSRLDSIEAVTSSYLVYSDLSGLNSYTGSANSRFASLEAVTGSYVVTGSVSDSTVTLEKADGSTFTLDIVSSIFRATGSNYNTTNDIGITGSLDINFVENNQEFRITSQSVTQFKINNEGIAVFTAQTSEPAFVSGGIYYSSTGAFFLGTTD